MKTLALLFLAVIISSTGLTSCIDEEIDPAVVAIYQNQALLLSSQANLNDAQATYQIALANLQDAYAAAALSAAADASAESAQNVLSQAAMTAISVAAAAQNLSEAEEALLQTIAMNAIALETALANLEIAKLQWEANMIALQAAIDDVHVALASGYFNNYMSAKNSAIAQEALAVMKQSDIDVAQLLLVAIGDVTWEYYLAQQEDILTGLQADLVAKEAAAAALTAVIADPSTAASTSSELQAMQDENDDTMQALYVEIAALDAELIPISEELDSYWDIDSDYHDAMDDVEDYEDDVEDAEDAVMYAEDDIMYAEENLLSYDDDLAAAEAAVVAAELAYDAAELVEDAAQVANDLAYDDVVATNADYSAAVGERNLRQAEWDAQEGAVNLAAAALVAAGNTAVANDGAAAELVTLNAEIADQGLAVVEYNFARSLFEADPSGTTYVEGEHNGVDGVLGNHTDILGDSYMQILTVNTTPPVVAADVTFTGSLISDGSVAPVLGNEAGVWAALTAGDNGLYFDAELDDVAPAMSNVDRFAAATTAKLLADADVVTAQGVYDDALDAESTVAQDLIDAQDAYDAQVVIFEDNGAAIVLAQGVVDAALIVYTTAQGVYAAADIALTAAESDLDDADDDLDDAEYDLMDLVDYSNPAMLQEYIEMYTHDLAVANLELGMYQALLADALVVFADLEVAFEEASLNSAATLAAYIAIGNQQDDLYDEIDALDMMNYQMYLVIDAIGMDNGDLQAILDGMLAAIPACNDAIEAQEVIIAVGSIDEAAAQAAITQLEAELANIESQINGYNTLATKYWDLMQAALAG